MDFSHYNNEIEEVFLESPVIVLDHLLKNQPKITAIDIIKLTVLIQEAWMDYQHYGINLIVTIDTQIETNTGVSIKGYDFSEDIQEILKISNYRSAEFVININGFIQDKKYSNTNWDIGKISQKMHFDNKVAFFLGLNGLDTIINGVVFESKNHLSSYKDIMWTKLVSVASYTDLLNRFFNEYVQYDNQKRYFLYNESIHPDWKAQLHKHPKLLINKPEEKFQLDLVRFLKDNCQDAVLKEVQNDENERYDIWIGTDQKEVYIFELKWLGKSITPSGGVNSKYNTEERAFEGAYQLRDYIQNEERTLEGTAQSRIHLGVLVLFDARDEMGKINYPEEVKNIPNIDLNQHFMIEKDKVKASMVYKSMK